LVHTYAAGTDPSERANPRPIRNTVTTEVALVDGGHQVLNANIRQDVWGLAPEMGSFTVLDNDFSTGSVSLTLGDYQLISYVDFTPGATVHDTALAISASITKLPGFSASVVGAVVSVIYDTGTADIVEFSVLQLGQKVNLGNFTPNNGYLAVGSPSIQPPIITG
jgi:hypothetical protein